jgi:hypothetical protein
MLKDPSECGQGRELANLPYTVGYKPNEKVCQWADMQGTQGLI